VLVAFSPTRRHAPEYHAALHGAVRGQRSGLRWIRAPVGGRFGLLRECSGRVGRRERAEVGDVSIDSRVSLLRTGERGFKLAVELDVTLPQVQDPEQAARIVAAAHQVCPYSNATRGNIDVTLTVNGRDVG
jgi:hypothetical protein